MDDVIVDVKIENQPPQPYPVVVGCGAIKRLGLMLRNRYEGIPKVAVVWDATVKPFWEEAVRHSLTASRFDIIEATIESGEDKKQLSTLLPVYSALLGGQIDRHTPLIGVGGGVLTDMAGFVAATILRGVPLVQIPTTLLCMVDASVGGKTAINHAVGKNLIGAFHQPDLVVIDPLTLQTLPESAMRDGLAECIKHGAIADSQHFAELENALPKVIAKDMDVISTVVAKNVAIKARVVEQDPKEKGIRAHLNFGHTFGHAIETLSDHGYTHGQAISIGMCAAADVSVRLGILTEQDRQRLVKLFVSAGLPTQLSAEYPLNAGDIFNTMKFDKKAKAGKIKFVLLKKIGEATTSNNVPDAMIMAALSLIGAR